MDGKELYESYVYEFNKKYRGNKKAPTYDEWLLDYISNQQFTNHYMGFESAPTAKKAFSQSKTATQPNNQPSHYTNFECEPPTKRSYSQSTATQPNNQPSQYMNFERSYPQSKTATQSTNQLSQYMNFERSYSQSKTSTQPNNQPLQYMSFECEPTALSPSGYINLESSLPSASSMSMSTKQAGASVGWPLVATDILVAEWKEKFDKLHTIHRDEVWARIASKVSIVLPKTTKQCQDKIRNLKDLYNKAFDANKNKTGGTLQTSPYYDSLGEVLSTRPSNRLNNVRQVGHGNSPGEVTRATVETMLRGCSQQAPGKKRGRSEDLIEYFTQAAADHEAFVEKIANSQMAQEKEENQKDRDFWKDLLK